MLLVNTHQINSIHEAYKAIHEINQATIRVWIETCLFTWQWWLGVGLTIVPWGIWFFLRKKDSKDRLLYAGFFIILIASWFDFAGVSLGLWSYNYILVPSIPAYIPWDFSLILVTTMLLLQYKPNVNPFIKAVFTGAMTAFVGEPIFKWIGLYNPQEWKYIYSFGIHVILYLMTHYMSRRKGFKKLTNSHK